MPGRRIGGTGAAAVLLLLGLGMAQAQAPEVSYGREEAARACVSKRLNELIAQENRNATADPALHACANELKAEMKEKGRNDCEVEDYFGWLIAGENYKINGVAAQPYRPNRAFLSRCRGRPR